VNLAPRHGDSWMVVRVLSISQITYVVVFSFDKCLKKERQLYIPRYKSCYRMRGFLFFITVSSTIFAYEIY
jgi:hypothetical protein